MRTGLFGLAATAPDGARPDTRAGERDGAGGVTLLELIARALTTLDGRTIDFAALDP